MNSNTKTKKESVNICNRDIKPNPLSSEKVEEENKTTSNCKSVNFKNPIEKTDDIFLTSDTPDNFFPYELYDTGEFPLIHQDKPDNSNVEESKEEKEKEKDLQEESCYTKLFNSCDKNYKLVKFDLAPFIFTEKYEKINNLIQETKISHYSFLNSINYGILSDDEFKLIEDLIKKKLSHFLNVDIEDINLGLIKSGYFYFRYECYVKMYEDSFNDLIENNELGYFLIDETKKEFEKQYEDQYKDEYKINGHIDYFNHLVVFLDMYFKRIYGFCSLYNSNISEVIKIQHTFNKINSFLFIQNTIPIKKFKTETNNKITKNILKMGFVYSGCVMEIV